jgi:6-pyruvoyltetrahydropterin/6-carboxytetrahydropterin synthase
MTKTLPGSVGPAHQLFAVPASAGPSASAREPGFVTGFGALAPFKEFLNTELDHHNLHEILPFEPASERPAQFLAGWLIQNLQPAIPGRLVAVLVREAQSSRARFDVEGQ